MEKFEEAKSLLFEATALDKGNKPNDAWVKYVQGIEILFEYYRGLPAGQMKDDVRSRLDAYMKRTEELRNSVKVETVFFEQRKIAANSTGHGYDKIFSRCLDDKLTSATVYDPYIKANHQLLNFVRFCELLVSKARNLRVICLITSNDCKANKAAFDELGESLKKTGQVLQLRYSDEIHDREIRFDNGWVVKIGRGLDYFKYVSRYSLGSCDMNLRPCLETIVDIYKQKS
ncbi:unnamed protein product [Auanema sp. JU1783]|nr:unnamed protein product [Auanema sp. JU1783]